MGKRGIRGLKARVGQECSISREGTACAVEVYMSEKSKEEVAVLRVGTQQEVAAPKVRAAKSYEFGEGKL